MKTAHAKTITALRCEWLVEEKLDITRFAINVKLGYSTCAPWFRMNKDGTDRVIREPYLDRVLSHYPTFPH